ncbi:MAG: shikimate dehydrogenase [Clostridiales bacterium]|nr:shikimate dehydrogenase [Clostridiales bacterium]
MKDNKHDPTRKFALIGYPLSHTMSPPIHDRLFALSGFGGECEYNVIEVPTDELATFSSVLRDLSGYNVTIPHKVSIINALDGLDPLAKRYGAVNCVKNGEKSIGYNTDVVGFLRTIRALGASLESDVLMLGCGGVGRMMAIETALCGGNITIAVRQSDLESASALKDDILCLSPNTSVNITTLDKIDGSYDLLINATPVGMYPHGNDMPIEADVLKRVRFLFDAIYNPVQTKLIKSAIKHGVSTIGGMSMLVWQAAAAHEIWNDAQFDIQDIDALIKRMENTVDKEFGQ